MGQSRMIRSIPYLRIEAIDQEAERLLHEYESMRRWPMQPPIPIDDIIEKHLKLGLEFDDMHKLLEIPREDFKYSQNFDVLGAIFFDEKRIVIDSSLDPTESSAKEGRLRFTLAHEVAHWQLHRSHFTKDETQSSLFENMSVPSVICRKSQAKESIEWQADTYAARLLMPCELVFAAWEEIFPDRKSRVLPPDVPVDHPFIEMPRISHKVGQYDYPESDADMLNRVVFPLAERFCVSQAAMRIRLEELGLLMREIPRQKALVTT